MEKSFETTLLAPVVFFFVFRHLSEEGGDDFSLNSSRVGGS